MKKLIMSKTLIFLFVFSFINIFIKLFGSSNTLIGVTVVTAMLMFLERDLTIEPIKNTFKLLAINVFLGILSFLAVQNIGFGVVSNFTALFVVGYLFTYDLKKPMYIAFGLQYLFMVGSPVSVNEFPVRLLSLAFGALCIMIPQFLVNKNKLEKSSKKIFVSTSEDILAKIKCIKENKTTEEINLKIENNINSLKKMLYDNRKDEFYLNDSAIDILNMGLSLERISLILDNYCDKETNDNILETVNKNKKASLGIMESEIKKLKLYIDKEESIEYNLNLDEIEDINLCEFYNVLNNIHDYFDEYKKRKNTKSEKLYTGNLEIPSNFKMANIQMRGFSKESIRFSYAVKVALAGAIAGFIMDYFNLSEGRWVMFTIFSVIQPYSENCIIKSKKRIQGTLVGGTMIFILFSIIKEPSMRGIVIILAGYLGSYTTDYRDSMIFNTMSAIGSAAMIGSVSILFINRILFVLLGIAIGLVVNKFILPYDIKKGYKYLVDMYERVNLEMIEEINLCIKSKHNNYKMKNLLLVPGLIEDRISLMGINDNEQKHFIKKQKHLTSSIYNLYVNIATNKIKDEDVKEILQESNCISECEEVKDVIIDSIKNTEDIGTKVACKNLLQILNSLNTKEQKITV
ncbi:FUSC family protein [Romboutsia lituseburensis]|uniref:FUSC family protein n=1 Tax=Romboutsia lituseburensis TaxID=1537 RepID=UPI00215AEBAB|nr:FUSC family protein [Romboutsia lituseburensis]MCR8747087.1 FUSC family protein [Romboutsia lituseburensis]